MFNLGIGEITLICVVALLLLGPQRLPELARGIGKFMREFRRQTDEVRGVVEREFYRMDQEVAQATALPDAVPSHSEPEPPPALGEPAPLNEGEAPPVTEAAPEAAVARPAPEGTVPVSGGPRGDVPPPGESDHG
jgi:sec-independent protein translocase protein TatB